MRSLALILALVGCVPPVVVVPNRDVDCPAACQRLRELNCPEGDPLPDGTTCEKFCSDTQKAGHDLHPECIAKIGTCADQAKCSK